MKAKSKFKAGTGLLGSTEPGQRVTSSNIDRLPPGSVVRNGDGSRIIHLHDNTWLWCRDGAWVYDDSSRMKMKLDKDSELCHIPTN